MNSVFDNDSENSISADLKKTSLFVPTRAADSDIPPVLGLLLEKSKIQRIESISYHYACFIYSHISERYPGQAQSNYNLAALCGAALMSALNQQHVCIEFFDIKQFVSDLLKDESDFKIELPKFVQWPEIITGFKTLVSLEQTTEQLNDALWAVGQQRLYIKRYSDYENTVVERILQAASTDVFEPTQSITQYVDSLFPKQNDEIDWQRIAVQNALGSRFYVISGGPGTGKTTTVVKLLLAIFKQFEDQGQFPRVKLAAPTGKAAARLSESLRDSLSKMELHDACEVPTEAETLHRLLKRLPNGQFYYDKNKPLPADVVVVDEASMVDLSMMSKLIEGLEPACQLILLGDKHQLSSVEAGSVLAEISEAQEGLNINVVTELQKSYRFDGKGEIGQLAGAIKSGDVNLASDLVARATHEQGEVQFWPEQAGALEKVKNAVSRHYQGLFELLKDLTVENEQARIHQTFKEMSKLQVLACTKLSEHGVDAFNSELSQKIKQRNQLSYWQHHFCSRPIMITENAYNLNLYNGDIGIEAIDPHSGQMVAYFPELSELGYRKVVSQRLPKHDSVYAMTVHKSQGSEFEHTFMLLPSMKSNHNILTRELLYTGLTRAKKQFTLIGAPELLRVAVSNQSNRRSGINSKLRQHLNSAL